MADGCYSSLDQVAICHPPSAIVLMALTATLYNFDVELSDVDRGVYETLAIRAACQPSETVEYLLTRVLAYCLEYAEGISFGKGLAEPDEPALTVRDLTGSLKVWIEVGAPDAGRLHRASMATPRVVVYTHKDPESVLRQLRGERIHKAEAIEIYSFDRTMLTELGEHLGRRTAFTLSVSDRELYLTLGDTTWNSPIVEHRIEGTT
jgi:uncharacterized protein YaeQ